MKKRIISYILSASLLLFLVACKQNTSQLSTETETPFSPSTYYSVESYSIPVTNQGTWGISQSFVYSYSRDESETYQTALTQFYEDLANGNDCGYAPTDHQGEVIFPEDTLQVFSFEGETVSEIDLDKQIGGTVLERKVADDIDGSIWIGSILVDPQSGTPSYLMDQIYQGGWNRQIELHPLVPVVMVKEIVISRSGEIYWLCNDDFSKDHILVFSKEGKQLRDIDVSEYTIEQLYEENGKAACLAWTKSDDLTIFNENDNGSSLEEKCQVKDSFIGVIRSGDVLYGWNRRTMTQILPENKTLLNWSENDVTVQPIDVQLGQEDQILVLACSRLGHIYSFRLTPSSEPTNLQKTSIVIAGYDLADTCIPGLVEEMSIRNPNVRYIMRDYKDEISSSEENWSQVQNEIYQILSLDIASGNAPDIYYDQYNDTGLAELSRLGYFTDLSDFVSSLEKGEYFLDKMTLYRQPSDIICLDYVVLGFLASPDYVIHPEQWSFDDFYASADQFSDYSSVQTIYSKQTLLMDMLSANISSFTSDGTADFNNPRYVQLLRFANDMGQESDWDEYGQTPINLNDGHIMLDWFRLNNTSMGTMGSNIVVGYPGEGGALHLAPNDLLAISNSSSNQELALEFLRYAISYDFQKTAYSLSGENSVNKRVLKEYIEKGYDYWSSNNNPAFSIPSTKEAYIDKYSELVERASSVEYASSEIINICLEEALSFFSGTYTPEHVAEITQDRVSIYIQERAGGS